MEVGFGTFTIVFIVIAAGFAFLMIRGTGWYALAAKYPERAPYTGQLRACASFQMVAIDSELSVATRFSGGMMSVGVTSDALYIVAPAVVRFLFRTIQLPWAAIASARPFEAPGWVKPTMPSGAAIQIRVEYDFGYTGDFIELETTAPRTRIRLPVYAIEDARSHLPPLS